MIFKGSPRRALFDPCARGVVHEQRGTCTRARRMHDALIMTRDNDLAAGRRSTGCLKHFHTTTPAGGVVGGGVLNSSRDDRALMRVRTPRGLTRISREACCRVIGIKMANGASIKGLTDFRLLSRAHAVGPPRRASRRVVSTVFPRPLQQRHMHRPKTGERETLGHRALRDSIARPEKFSFRPYPHRQRYSCVCVTDRRSAI